MNRGKYAAGKAAAELVKPGMLVGLGTGSTAACFIEQLAKRVHNGLKIKALATSNSSQLLAKQHGIPLIHDVGITEVDLTVDGADQIDIQKHMIKGAGGALLREKIIASMSRQLVIVVSEEKVVNCIGNCLLPIEIVPFAYHSTLEMLKKAGFQASLRKVKGDTPFVTDNQNYIVDAALNGTIQDPESISIKIKEIPGVIETGLFFKLPLKVIIGFPGGNIEIRS